MMIAAVTCTTPALAQTGQTAQIPLQFDFLNPGARSLALASSFIAVADDATAAFTNPAGLTFLIKPEVSAEIRYRRLDTPFLSGGRLSGLLTSLGQDTVVGPIYANSLDAAARPYFLSVVYPTGHWAVSAYRQELVRQVNDFATDGAFYQVVFAGTPVNNARQLGLTGRRNIKADNYGAAFAFRANDAISAGAGVAFYRFDAVSDFASFGHGTNIFGPVNTSDRGSTTTQRGTATKAAINAGVLWTADPKVRVGLVFRQGTAFEFTQVSVIPSALTINQTGDFRTPHVFGAGIRVQSTDQLSFAVDYDRVIYSRLKEDYIAFQVPSSAAGRVAIPDGNEVHGGAEYVFTSVPHTPSIRGGVWYDPNHAVQYTSDNTNSPDDVLLKAIFPGGDALVHYCFGFGMPVSPQFEFNAGVDVTKQRRYVSASLVARFGK
jgi:long-chain fatty acid transport protein